MSDRDEFSSMANVNGAIAATDEARIPVMDRGFLYGDSIYEVFRTYRGIPLFGDEHWLRFENSAALIHLAIGLTKEEMTEQIRRTVRATGAPAANRDVYVRYIVTRGEGPLDLHPPEDLPTSFVIIVRAVPQWNPEFYAKGLRVAVSRTRRNPTASLDPNIKGGNYLNNVLGVIEARKFGADDSLMLNDAGLVTEASNSNVFLRDRRRARDAVAACGEPARPDEGRCARRLPFARPAFRRTRDPDRCGARGQRVLLHERDPRDHARARTPDRGGCRALVPGRRRTGHAQGRGTLSGPRRGLPRRARRSRPVLSAPTSGACSHHGPVRYNSAPQRQRAPVVQLDRTPAYEAGSREFESLRARHPIEVVGRLSRTIAQSAQGLAAAARSLSRGL